MSATYRFRIYDADPMITNMLEIVLNGKGDIVESWKLCGLTGKVIRWDSPIKSGKGVYNGIVAELRNDQDGEKSRLVFRQPLSKLEIGDNTGKYTDSREISRSAILVDSPKARRAFAMFAVPA